NMKIEHFTISNEVVQAIVNNLKLTEAAQNEAIDRLVDRTPEWLSLESDEQTHKIKAALIAETIIEYLRLNEYVKDGVEMIEVGIKDDLSILASAFYVDNDTAIESQIASQLSEEELQEMENQINILDGSINIFEEAKKKMKRKNKMKKKLG